MFELDVDESVSQSLSHEAVLYIYRKCVAICVLEKIQRKLVKHTKLAWANFMDFTLMRSIYMMHTRSTNIPHMGYD